MPAAAKADRESIFQELRDDILHARLRPGDMLREVALSERFGVSRTPVRDALGRLEEAGLVVRTHRGVEVRAADPDQVIHVYEARILLEEEISGQAAARGGVTDLLTLEGLVSRDRALEDPSDGERMSTNMEFHSAVWHASKNPVLIDLLERLKTHLVHAPRSTLSVGDRWTESLDEHAALTEAISRRDVAEARRIAREHFETARRIRLELLRESLVPQR